MKQNEVTLYSFGIVHALVGIIILKAALTSLDTWLALLVALPLAAASHPVLDDWNMLPAAMIHELTGWAGKAFTIFLIPCYVVLLWLFWHHPIYILAVVAAMWADFEHPIRWYYKWRTGQDKYWLHVWMYPDWLMTPWAYLAWVVVIILLLVVAL